MASNPLWTDENKNKLEWLKLATIHISDTSYAWFEKQQKRDTSLVIERMTLKDRAAFLGRFALMAGSDGANHNQPDARNITLI